MYAILILSLLIHRIEIYIQSIIKVNSSKTKNSLIMCMISKKIKFSDVREKRLAIIKKLQGEMFLSFAKKLAFGSTPIIIQQKSQKLSEDDTTGASSPELSKSERNSRIEADNEFYEKYEVLQKIGQGGHSSVYKCQKKESGKVFAVKITRCRDEEMIINSKQQFEYNKVVSNSSIIKLEELIVDDHRMTTYNVQQYCDLRNLKEELESRKSGKFSQLQATKLIKSLLQTLQFLHSIGICHRDIKPQNILYNPQNGEIKLIDLECSKNKKETEQQFEMWTKTGTFNYQAPQYFLKTIFSQKVDIWATGIVAYEILTGRLPFESPYHKKTVQLIISQEIDFSQLKLSEDLEKLLKGILEKEPALRLGIEQALSLCDKAIEQME